MNCNECQHQTEDQHSITTGKDCTGLEVTRPCHRECKITVECSGFTKKTTPVDPALTQESVCGECGTFTAAENLCTTFDITKDQRCVACVKFKSKPSDKPLKAADCPAFTATDHGDLGTCATTGTVTCHGDGDACEAMQRGGP